MFASFDDRGRLFVFESTSANEMDTDSMLAHPAYQIRLLTDENDDGLFDRSSIFARNIPFPMGGTFHQGSLYVTASPDLLKFTDTDGDGIADDRQVILTGWTLNSNGAILSGPFIGPDGWMYLADARRGFKIETKEGKVLEGKGARIWRCLPDGSRLESMCGGGFDNSIEIIFMPSGETIGTMTYFRDPEHGQRDALMHWVEGGVYPKFHPVIEEDDLKLSGELMPVMTKLPRVAPSGLMRYESLIWGPEYSGNLFSAEFNTGRIMRHRVQFDGATFKTTEEVFIDGLVPDLHPTDVLEDASGHLLVLITGGWFIRGCPLSRVAKPEIPGGIYRIKKNNVSLPADPWGLKIDFNSLAAADLIPLLDDQRVKVKAKASDALVQRGAASINAIKSALTSENENVRNDLIYILSRINTSDALALVRIGLQDKEALVRISSARILGLCRDTVSVDELIHLLERDEAPVRRQAATALGQIGHRRAVTPLLLALPHAFDRIEEHALIFSLIELADRDALIAALDHPQMELRRAALIALDQLDASPLLKNRMIEYLKSEHEALRKIGVWVLLRHPEWSDLVVEYLDQAINASVVTEQQRTWLTDLMTNFCGSEPVYNLLAKKLLDRQISPAIKMMILQSMSRCPSDQFVLSWKWPLANLLDTDADELQQGVLDLIEAQQVSSLNEELDAIIYDTNQGAELLLSALSAKISGNASLTSRDLDLLIQYLDTGQEASIRQKATQVLSRSKLSGVQLQKVAKDLIPQTDLFLLQAMVEPFKGDSSEVVGLALVTALEAVQDKLYHLSADKLHDLIEQYPAAVGERAKDLFQSLRKQQATRLDQLEKLEKEMPKGDVGEGRKLFFGKATCFTCHAVGTEGSGFGPDLTNIGEIRSQHDILEAIVFPSVSFAREYETYEIVTNTGTFRGIIKQQFAESLMLSIGPGQDLRINRQDIRSLQLQENSLMPPGLHEQLSIQELADLMTFLKALPYEIERLIEMKDEVN